MLTVINEFISINFQKGNVNVLKFKVPQRSRTGITQQFLMVLLKTIPFWSIVPTQRHITTLATKSRCDLPSWLSLSAIFLTLLAFTLFVSLIRNNSMTRNARIHWPIDVPICKAREVESWKGNKIELLIIILRHARTVWISCAQL